MISVKQTMNTTQNLMSHGKTSRTKSTKQGKTSRRSWTKMCCPEKLFLMMLVKSLLTRGKSENKIESIRLRKLLPQRQKKRPKPKIKKKQVKSLISIKPLKSIKPVQTMKQNLMKPLSQTFRR
jgi:hypothetical protein